jgi:hypothetical protein
VVRAQQKIMIIQQLKKKTIIIIKVYIIIRIEHAVSYILQQVHQKHRLQAPSQVVLRAAVPGQDSGCRCQTCHICSSVETYPIPHIWRWQGVYT